MLIELEFFLQYVFGILVDCTVEVFQHLNEMPLKDITQAVPFSLFEEGRLELEIDLLKVLWLFQVGTGDVQDFCSEVLHLLDEVIIVPLVIVASGSIHGVRPVGPELLLEDQVPGL